MWQRCTKHATQTFQSTRTLPHFQIGVNAHVMFRTARTARRIAFIPRANVYSRSEDGSFSIHITAFSSAFLNPARVPRHSLAINRAMHTGNSASFNLLAARRSSLSHAFVSICILHRLPNASRDILLRELDAHRECVALISQLFAPIGTISCS